MESYISLEELCTEGFDAISQWHEKKRDKNSDLKAAALTSKEFIDHRSTDHRLFLKCQCTAYTRLHKSLVQFLLNHGTCCRHIADDQMKSALKHTLDFILEDKQVCYYLNMIDEHCYNSMVSVCYFGGGCHFKCCKWFIIVVVIGTRGKVG